MPKDAPPNGDAAIQHVREDAFGRVSGMQTKLHRWAAADPGRRFDDLFNLVHDPATLIVAFERVAGNTGARTAGSDGLTVAHIEQQIGVPAFLDGIRSAVKDGSFRPQPVRERKIPKPGGSGKVRKLGIPTDVANGPFAQAAFGLAAGDVSVPPSGRPIAGDLVLKAAWRWSRVRLRCR
jgi:RNA-directed DNA polymerase